MKPSKIARLVVILVALAMVVLAACVPAPAAQPPSAPAATTPVASNATAAPKIIRIATAQGCTTMSVSLAGGMGPCDVQVHQIIEGLTWRTADGKVVPLLATSWNMVDSNNWQVKLRSGVKFHNGEPLNAEAVKFSWDKALDAKNNWPIRANIVLVDKVTIVDELTVNFHTSSPWADFPFFASPVYIMPPKYTQQVG